MGLLTKMGIGNLTGGLSGLLGGGEKPVQPGFLKTLVKGDLGVADQSVKEGKWELVGEYTVPAQQEIAVGFGTPAEQLNQARIFVDLKDAVADLLCMCRVQIVDANDVLKPYGIAIEERGEPLSSGTDDRTKQVPLPEYLAVRAGRDDKIQIWVNADADDALTLADSVIRIPTTVYRR